MTFAGGHGVRAYRPGAVPTGRRPPPGAAGGGRPPGVPVRSAAHGTPRSAGSGYVTLPDAGEGPRRARAPLVVGPHAVLPRACATAWPRRASSPSPPTCSAGAPPTTPPRPRPCSGAATWTSHGRPGAVQPVHPAGHAGHARGAGRHGGLLDGRSWALWLAARVPELVAATVAFYGTQSIDMTPATIGVPRSLRRARPLRRRRRAHAARGRPPRPRQGRRVPPLPRHRTLVLRARPRRLRRGGGQPWPGTAPSPSSTTAWGVGRRDVVGGQPVPARRDDDLVAPCATVRPGLGTRTCPRRRSRWRGPRP